MSTHTPALTPGLVPMAAPVDLYSEAVDLRTLSPEELERYGQHRLRRYPTWLAVVLSIVTLGAFPFFFYLAKHGQLPHVKHDDPSAGKAIGFMFIPFYGIYWTFVAWPRLVDRINLQYRLRGQVSPLSKGTVMTTLILSIFGGLVVVGWLVGAVVALVLIAKTQNAINGLADARSAEVTS